MTFDYWQAAIVIGLGATLVMDLGGLLQKHLFKVPAANFCMVGRWLGYFSKGVFRHSNITKTPGISGECALGWTAHYLIGILFSFILIYSVPTWLERPSISTAIVFGVLTLALPFFVMQPGFGFGIASAKTSAPAKARLKSLLTHSVFAVGLYFSTLTLNIFVTYSVN